jgi:hypothetical protein
MGATEEPAVHLHTVPDYPAAAVLTRRRESVYRAFERIEHMHGSGCVDLE